MADGSLMAMATLKAHHKLQRSRVLQEVSSQEVPVVKSVQV
jgi:hypothetical protein